MIPSIIQFGEQIRDAFKQPIGNALEVGSYNVNGTIRSAFEAASESYVGVDLMSGPGVDRVVDAEKLPFADEQFDTVLCCECLEHCVQPWVVVEELKRVLKPGGLLFVSTPTFGFPLHRYPLDCYRFGEDAYRMWLFRDFRIIELSELHDALGNPVIACGGIKLAG